MQLRLPFPRRKKRGRPKKRGAGVSHLTRPALAARFPVHLTLRVRRHVWNLRSRRCFTALERAFYGGGDRFGFRLNHYTVQGNHLHFIGEATDRQSLSKGMQGLAIRMAKGLNRVMDRRGGVFADRYHGRILRTPTEVRHALHYVRHQRHFDRPKNDPYTAPLTPPRTWLLRAAAPPPGG